MGELLPAIRCLPLCKSPGLGPGILHKRFAWGSVTKRRKTEQKKRQQAEMILLSKASKMHLGESPNRQHDRESRAWRSWGLEVYGAIRFLCSPSVPLDLNDSKFPVPPTEPPTLGPEKGGEGVTWTCQITYLVHFTGLGASLTPHCPSPSGSYLPIYLPCQKHAGKFMWQSPKFLWISA